MFDQQAINEAHAETERLTRELDIANADHTALWLEANSDAPLGFIACRIAEAHEATMRNRLVEVNEAISWAMAEIDGLTIYSQDEQREHAYDQANKVAAELWADIKLWKEA